MNLLLVLSSRLRLGHPSGRYLSFVYQNPILLPTCHMPRPSHPSWFNCWNYLCAAGYNVLWFWAICVSPPQSSLTLSVSLLSTCAIIFSRVIGCAAFISASYCRPCRQQPLCRLVLRGAQSSDRGCVWLCGWNWHHMNMHVLHRTLSVESIYSDFGAVVAW